MMPLAWQPLVGWKVSGFLIEVTIMTEFTGKDQESAIRAAEGHLATDRQHLQITIIQTARRGIFGIGRRPAKIEAKKRPEQPPKRSLKASTTAQPAQQAKPHKQVVQQVAPHVAKQELSAEEQLQAEMAANHQKNLAMMHQATDGLTKYLTSIYANLGVTVQPEIIEERAHNCSINLVTEQPGKVIGYHGRRINAVEQLGAVYLNYHGVHDVQLMLDTGDYRAKRRAALEKIMERSITQVIATGQAVFLDPMPARERKFLHKLAERQGQVRTYSHGREPFRSIVIAPKN
ncbi:RNA-binding cell elongation regulator Jag/EloR [Limosilactobacillus caecicola]|uniref:RNA-binding cell elongation regulator Jag/EloR n=1 Tax=Limosilactobacillus caecicola TaxID=2941332 RepID=UPI00204030B9|nr:RNA-binding cell elongation regulator Jag/EloR [Limosilactobacillus caecicola]